MNVYYRLGHIPLSFMVLLESSFDQDVVQEQYTEQLISRLIYDLKDTTLIDDVWVGGISERKFYLGLRPEYREMIDNLNTRASICFLNGVHGRAWDSDLP